MQHRRSFGLAAILLLASAGSSGAAGLQCLVPVRPADNGETGSIGEIVDVGNGARLIGAENGLYRLDAAGLSALWPEDGGATGGIGRIVDAGDGVQLIGADSGLYRLDAAGLSALRSADGGATGGIGQIVDAGNGAQLIGAQNGLYRLDARGLAALLPAKGGETGDFTRIFDAGNGVWLVGAISGVYRLDADGLAALLPADGGETGRVRQMVDDGNGAVLIDAENGQYRADARGLTALPPAERGEAGGIKVRSRRVPDREIVVGLGNGAWLVGDRSGLYRRDAAGRAALRPANGSETGYVSNIVEAGNDVWLIDARNGLYRFDAAGLTALRPADGSETGYVREFIDAGNDTLLINTRNGLYRFDAAGLTALLPTDPEAGGNLEIFDVRNGTWLISSSSNLYRFDAAGLTALRPADGGEAGDIGRIFDTGNGGWLIVAEDRLYRLDPAIDPVVADDGNVTRNDARNDAVHSFEWLIRHPCVGLFPDADLLGVRFAGNADWVPAVVQRPGAEGDRDVVRVGHREKIQAENGATVTATVGFRPRKTATFQPMAGSETVVKVGWGPWDYVKDAVSRFGPWALAAQALLFGGLLLAARRRAWAWNVVTDPLWGKVGLWFWALLRFVPGLQRWVLARWLDALRKESPAEDYLPMPLTRPGSREVVSTELAAALGPGRRVWLQGAAGMGKTALFDHVVADYCAGAGDLGAAFARWGYVPLPIALRDFAQVAVPTAPEDWLFDLAGRRLEAAGLRVEDARLLRGMLTAGYWVLLLDGANEVDDKGAVQQFARRFPQVGMLVTSQAEPRAEAAGLFELWRLPPDIRAAIGPLLELYLGPERGGEVLRRIEGTSIAGDIRSGYDVRLVAELVKGGTAPGTLPWTRAGLYDAMLAAAGPDYPVADLCRVAWGCWVAGRRDLRPGDNIAASLLEPLKRPGVRVVRAQDGASWQFRHDQMRAYLAARWAAKEEVSPVDLFAATPAIWRLGKSEQQVVWEFFARLLDDDTNRRVLAWADEEAERAELQVVLRRTWRTRVVPWKPPKRDPAEAPGR